MRVVGDDNNLGTSKSQAFRTISRAARSAGNGDTIYIGAGTYDEAISFNGARKSSLDQTTIAGDQTGAHTGDKGAVTIRSLENRWAIYATNASKLVISGIAFEPHPSLPTYTYGCSITNCSNSATFF